MLKSHHTANRTPLDPFNLKASPKTGASILSIVTVSNVPVATSVPPAGPLACPVQVARLKIPPALCTARGARDGLLRSLSDSDRSALRRLLAAGPRHLARSPRAAAAAAGPGGGFQPQDPRGLLGPPGRPCGAQGPPSRVSRPDSSWHHEQRSSPAAAPLPAGAGREPQG